jgi:hypothetical protein
VGWLRFQVLAHGDGICKPSVCVNNKVVNWLHHERDKISAIFLI